LWQTAQEMVRSDFRAEPTSIHVPSPILWGERDVLLPLASGQQFREALPHATFISLPICRGSLLAHRQILNSGCFEKRMFSFLY